jgi:hypothetical protein
LFSDLIELQSGPDSELAPIRDFAAKAAEHAARIAGVLSTVRDPQTREINVEAMSCGITLAEWYVIEARRLHGAARMDPKLVRAQRLLGWLRRQAEAVVAFRDILRCGPIELRAKEPAEAALRTLVDHGLIVEVGARPRSY